MNYSIRLMEWLKYLARLLRPSSIRRGPNARRVGMELLEDRLVPDSTGTVGSGVPLDITAPSLPVHYIICVEGIFPTRGSDVDGAGGGPYLGEVQLYASDTQVNPGEPMPGWDYCDGQLLPINQNQALFSILGKTFGGDGIATFALPDLRGRAAVDVGQTVGGPIIVDGKQTGAEADALTLNQIPIHNAPLPGGGSTGSVGGGKPISLDMPSLGIHYIIAESGIVSDLGEVRLFAGNFAPDGWVFCSGQILSISKFPDLFSVVGNTYGGNGKTTFALPNLMGRMAIGAGTGLSDPALGARFGSTTTTLSTADLPIHNYPLPGGGTTGNVGGGQSLDTAEPSLGLNYIISLVGVYQGIGEGTPGIGEIEPFAGTVVPVGWALCDGSLMEVSNNEALFSLLGTTYGGDGTNTFALPDLRGRIPVEAGQGTNLTDRVIGQPFGGGTVSVANLPPESLSLPVLTVSVKPDSPSVMHGGKAGFTLTIGNTDTGTVAGGLTLSDPLPDFGNGNTWSINGGVSAKSFTITGASGSQQLNLAPNITSLNGGVTLVVHIAGNTSITGPSSSINLTDTATVNSPDVTIQNPSSSASVVVVHTAPVLSKVEATTLSYHAGIPIAITSTMTATDSDSTTLAGATVSIKIGFAPAEDTLDFTDQNGITGSYISGVLTLTGNASVADYQAALRSVTYQDTSLTPSTAVRTITFLVDDGALNHNQSVGISRKISVGSHVAPVLAGIEVVPLSYHAGIPVAITTSLTVTDPDSSDLSGATISIGPGFSTDDVLGFIEENGITTNYDNTKGILTLSGSASVADYQLALRSVTFQNADTSPSLAVRTIDFQVTDGFGVNSQSKFVPRKINVAAHVAPVLSKIEPATLSYKAGQTINVTGSLTVADSDNSNLVGATVSFAPGFIATEDVLNFTSANGITGSYEPSTGVLSLSGTASLADYEAVLRSVTYTDSSNTPTAGIRTIIFQVTDDFGINSQSKSISRKIKV